MAQVENHGGALIRLPKVVEMTTLSRATVYAKIAAGEFPPQIKLSARRSAWRLADVEAWINQRAGVMQ